MLFARAPLSVAQILRFLQDFYDFCSSENHFRAHELKQKSSFWKFIAFLASQIMESGGDENKTNWKKTNKDN